MSRTQEVKSHLSEAQCGLGGEQRLPRPAGSTQAILQPSVLRGCKPPSFWSVSSHLRAWTPVLTHIPIILPSVPLAAQRGGRILE